MNARNLIMGLWSGLPAADLEPFLGSLRHTRFDGDVCVFVGDVTPDVVDMLAAHNVIVERAARFRTLDMNYLCSRFYSYLDYLTRHADQYSNVMLSDLRDVVFQDDPFMQPLFADIVYAQERCLIGDCPVNNSWIVHTYGAATAHAMRDCPISCSGTTFGTVSGMLRYLTAMTEELRTAKVPRADLMDQGPHNHIVHMRPLHNAWLDPTDSLVATMHYVPEHSVAITGDGVLIDGRRVPVLHQWQKHAALAAYIRSRAGHQPKPAIHVGRHCPHAVLCFYERDRDINCLAVFMASLRAVGFAGAIHCIGAFDDGELAILARHRSTPHQPLKDEPMIGADNLAHICFSRLLDDLATDGRTTEVMVFESVHAAFQRNPFEVDVTGLSVFCEGPVHIADSEFNLHRVEHFGPADAALREQPIISSAVLRGSVDVMRVFYRRLLAQYIGQADLLRIDKGIQGAVNRVCHEGSLPFPIDVHPNGSVIYFQIWPPELPAGAVHDVRVGSAVPAVIFDPFEQSELVRTLARQLRISHDTVWLA